MDEVIFVVHTDVKEDLVYLDQIVNQTEGYKKHEQEKEFDGWVGPWELVERGNIYIKIDGESSFGSEIVRHRTIGFDRAALGRCPSREFP